MQIGFHKSLQGIIVNGTVVNLLVKINPTVTQDKNNKKYLQLELRHSYTNIPILHTSYNLTLTRLASENDFSEYGSRSFHDIIHSHGDPLKIAIHNNNSLNENEKVGYLVVPNEI